MLGPYADAGLVGTSARWVRALETAAYLAPIPAPVLLLGETGTGKESVARLIHARSGRKGPFVAFNCSALTLNPGLAESRLFGYVGGVYSGGLKSGAIGLFQEAEGGTLFLDEGAELDVTVQPLLLRALELGQILPVGARTERPVDVRIVFGTWGDLPSLVRRGEFRSDLYHRLSGLVVRLPPLRERLEDVPALVAHLLATDRTLQLARARLEPGAIEALQGFHWPGNVRELRNAVLMAAVERRGEVVRAEDINAVMGGGPSSHSHRTGTVDPGRHPSSSLQEGGQGASNLPGPASIPASNLPGPASILASITQGGAVAGEVPEEGPEASIPASNFPGPASIPASNLPGPASITQGVAVAGEVPEESPEASIPASNLPGPASIPASNLPGPASIIRAEWVGLRELAGVVGISVRALHEGLTQRGLVRGRRVEAREVPWGGRTRWEVRVGSLPPEVRERLQRQQEGEGHGTEDV